MSRDILRNGPHDRPAREAYRLMGGFERRSPSFVRAVEIVRLRKTRSVDPHNLIADLKARVLNLQDTPVLGARAEERHQVPARLNQLEAFCPKRRVRYVIVPRALHERDAVGRVRHDTVHRGKRGKYVPAIGLVERAIAYMLNPHVWPHAPAMDSRSSSGRKSPEPRMSSSSRPSMRVIHRDSASWRTSTRRPMRRTGRGGRS